MKMLIAVAFAVSGAVASYLAPSPVTAPANLDSMQTAAISGGTSANSGMKSYSISNIAENSVCILKRGSITTPRTRDMEAAANCDDVWPGLADARNWTENNDGTVVLSDAGGNEVLQLVPGDGAAYMSVDTPSTPLTVSVVR